MPPDDLQPGETFAGHRIDAVAGRGGMGVVYRATQLDLDRTVAVKLITPALAEDPAFRDRFVRETRVAAGIDHPNVIPVFYAGEHEGRLYLAMRYVLGDDLRTLVRREGLLDAARAVRIVAQVAAALDAAHASGIVHRDVKPANVLLGAGEHAYLTDFGLTKRVHSASGTTQASGWVGTLGFVAPEQIRGERVDARADVYALGCVLHHALTGSPPHQRESDEATLWAHVHEPPPVLGPDVPAALAEVVERALAKAPDDRYPSAGDLGRAARSATGLDDGVVPERVVATGPAAPAGLRPPVDAETTAPAAASGTLPAPTTIDPTGGRPRPAFLIIAGTSVALVAALVALLLRTGDPPTPTSTTAPTTNPRLPSADFAPARLDDAAIPAGSRPNDVVSTAGITWASSATDSTLTRISSRRPRRLGTARVGVGVQNLAVGYDTLWVAKQKTRSLLRRDPRTGDSSGAAFTLPAGLPVVVATGQGGVWVALRGPDQVVRLNPQTGAIDRTVPIPTGVQDMAVGEGAVWVVERRHRGVVRVDTASGATKVIPVGDAPRGIAVGNGFVWVCNSGDDTITRISPDTRRTRGTFRVGDTPTGIDVGGGSVWVTNKFGGSVTRIDAGGRPRVLQTITGLTNPFAVAARGKDVWVTDPPTGTVRHLRF